MRVWSITKPAITGPRTLTLITASTKNSPALPTWLSTTMKMPALKERAKTLVELFEATRFLWASRPLDINEQAAGKVASSVDGVKSVENRIAVIKGS